MHVGSHTTDKALLTALVCVVLFAAVYTQNATILDAFKVGFGAAIYALASRIGSVKE